MLKVVKHQKQLWSVDYPNLSYYSILFYIAEYSLCPIETDVLNLPLF
jgi:hypothetical protein